MTKRQRCTHARSGSGALDEKSIDALAEVLYEQLHGLAAGYLKSDSADQLLEPSALVNETYIRLARQSPPAWNSTEHFLAAAAAAMRRVLIDYARRRRTIKRGHGCTRVMLEVITTTGSQEVDIRAVDDALNRLAAFDQRASRIIELRFFAGLTNERVADVLGVSRKTVVADWGRARDWLAHELAAEPSASPIKGGTSPAGSKRPKRRLPSPNLNGPVGGRARADRRREHLN